jgi:hypothetical protein
MNDPRPLKGVTTEMGGSPDLRVAHEGVADRGVVGLQEGTGIRRSRLVWEATQESEQLCEGGEKEVGEAAGGRKRLK